MIPIYFHKMHGLGNDFVILKPESHRFTLEKKIIQQWADRYQGIGFDQLILLESTSDADFFCRIYNADGSEAVQCGNGLRCVAKLLHDQALTKKNHVKLATLAGIFDLEIQSQTISMKLPAPLIVTPHFPITHEGERYHLSLLSVGNPHAILKISSLETFPCEALAATINHHPTFHQGINIGFMATVSDSVIALRTFERGSGETHACGSNAVAAASIAIKTGQGKTSCQIKLKYGDLQVHWPNLGNEIILEGPAEYVYEGKILVNEKN